MNACMRFGVCFGGRNGRYQIDGRWVQHPWKTREWRTDTQEWTDFHVLSTAETHVSRIAAPSAEPSWNNLVSFDWNIFNMVWQNLSRAASVVSSAYESLIITSYGVQY